MKQDRHTAILRLIETEDIETQTQLAERLLAMHISATQATVSRDIRHLHLIKRQIPGGKSIYAVSSGGTKQGKEWLVRVLQDSVKDVDFAQNIMVIKTEAGMAMAAAASIDSIPDTGILGCIAGDDTIIAVLKTTEDAQTACIRLRHDLRLN